MSVTRPGRPRRIAWSLLGWLLFLAFAELLAARQSAGALGADFRSFYAAGYRVRTHPHDLSLLILPFSLVRTRAARIVTGVLYVLSLVLFLLGQTNALFVLALPVLALLGTGAWSRRVPGRVMAGAGEDVHGLHAARIEAGHGDRAGLQPGKQLAEV